MKDSSNQGNEANRSSRGDLEEVWMMVDGLEDVADISPNASSSETTCDWCEEPSSSGYFVAISDERYGLCPICWGRSPDYVELRREGFSHESAYRKLMGEPMVPVPSA